MFDHFIEYFFISSERSSKSSSFLLSIICNATLHLNDQGLSFACVFPSDKKPLEIDARMNMIACPDGRQLLMIMQTTKKDAGVYECVATNPLASVSSSCIISLARKNWEMIHLSVSQWGAGKPFVCSTHNKERIGNSQRTEDVNVVLIYILFIGLPNCPGTPEIPQKYNNTALVLWRPSDTMAPCTYSLERRTEGQYLSVVFWWLSCSGNMEVKWVNHIVRVTVSYGSGCSLVGNLWD